MAQRIFQSFRRLPGHLASFAKKSEVVAVQGNTCKINVCCNYGFPAKPTSIAYDPILDLIAVLTRDGDLQIYGRPGVLFTASHVTSGEYIKVAFIPGTHRLVTLSGSDDIFLWEIIAQSSSSVRLVEIHQLRSVTSCLSSALVNGGENGFLSGPDQHYPADEAQIHITAVCCTADTNSVLIGLDNGWVASVSIIAPTKGSKERAHLLSPSMGSAVTQTRVLRNVRATQATQRLVLDAVVVISERPGFHNQVLIGYNSGLCVIFDPLANRTLALLPWKHELESAAWCGGSGFPSRSSIVYDVSQSADLGSRLLTAYADGSLGVWSLKAVHAYSAPVLAVPNAGDPISLNMEEPPSMPYGPFPCKLISKVFWLSSPLGGITVFAGGMPRARFGDRHTVSLLRGSNLDRAAADNLLAARMAVVESRYGNGLGDAGDGNDDDDELINADSHVLHPPMHVFDSDAPEHVCLDLPSQVVDVVPVCRQGAGAGGGAAQLLLILCEEELVAVDLLSPGWPFIRPPYLACLHMSAITTYSLLTQVNLEFLQHLEAAGSRIGPEGHVGRGSQVARNSNAGSWSHRNWPIAGGQAMVSGTRLSACSQDSFSTLLFTDDLLLTGHEDGSVIFWRLGAGGCIRRIYTLHSAILFEGDFHLPSHVEDESWPPFRQAGVFDPFTDDRRAAVQLVRLVDNTLVVGGAAGQITVWQMLNFVPSVSAVQAVIKSELPGFQWKGHPPLKMVTDYKGNVSSHPQLLTPNSPISRQRQASAPIVLGAQLQAVGVILLQPPARVTALSLAQLKGGELGHQQLLAFGSPHGYGVVQLASLPATPIQTSSAAVVLLLTECTLPANLVALQEAAAGEGWARRRTRELKKSLRDSFRRLRRMRSTSRPAATPSQPVQAQAEGSRRFDSRSRGAALTTAPVKASSFHRAGLQRSVTQTHRSTTVRVNLNPLEAAERRAAENAGVLPVDHFIGPAALSSGVEREICERPTDSASVAIVSSLTFGPPLFRSSADHSSSTVGSLFVSTKAGVMVAYTVLSRKATAGEAPSATVAYRLFKVKQLTLQHRAPILTVRLMNHTSQHPLVFSGLEATSSPLHRSTSSSSLSPSLLVTSEEQVRLFTLPALRLRYKARITAKDGYRIKAGTLVAFQQGAPTASKAGQHHQLTNGENADCSITELCPSGTSVTSTPTTAGGGSDKPTTNYEYAFAFTNIGGQAAVLNLPQLTRKDTLPLLDSNDVLAVNSVVFGEPGTAALSTGTSRVTAPSLGVYQLAPGQLTLFDLVRMGQRSSPLAAAYRPVYRLTPATTTGASGHPPTVNTTAVSARFTTTASNIAPPVGQQATGTAADNCPLTRGGNPSSSNNTSGCYSYRQGSASSYACSQLNSSASPFSGAPPLGDWVREFSGNSVSPSSLSSGVNR